jgi:hypothetical protein
MINPHKLPRKVITRNFGYSKPSNFQGIAVKGINRKRKVKIRYIDSFVIFILLYM